MWRGASCSGCTPSRDGSSWTSKRRFVTARANRQHRLRAASRQLHPSRCRSRRRPPVAQMSQWTGSVTSSRWRRSPRRVGTRSHGAGFGRSERCFCRWIRGTRGPCSIFSRWRQWRHWARRPRTSFSRRTPTVWACTSRVFPLRRSRHSSRRSRFARTARRTTNRTPRMPCRNGSRHARPIVVQRLARCSEPRCSKRSPASSRIPAPTCVG